MKKFIFVCFLIAIGCTTVQTRKNTTWTAFTDKASERIGFKDQDGNIKIKPRYVDFIVAKKFDAIMSVVEEKNGQYEKYFITKSGKTIGKDSLYTWDYRPDCENEGFIRFRDKKTDTAGIYNGNGDVSIPAVYNDLTQVRNGLVVALQGAQKDYGDKNKHSGCRHYRWVGGKTYLIDTQNRVLIEDFKLDHNLDLYSIKIEDKIGHDELRQYFPGTNGKYYSFINVEKEFRQWLNTALLDSISRKKVTAAAYKYISLWKKDQGWVKEESTEFIKRNYELLKRRLTTVSKTGADYFISTGGAVLPILDEAEFAGFFNNCGDVKKWKHPVVELVINHKAENDSYQDMFEFLRTEDGFKLLNVTIRNETLQ